jgi:hypothetical protein
LAAADQHWLILDIGAFDFWPSRSFQPIQCPYVLFSWLGLLTASRMASLKLLGATGLAGQDLVGDSSRKMGRRRGSARARAKRSRSRGRGSKNLPLACFASPRPQRSGTPLHIIIRASLYMW